MKEKTEKKNETARKKKIAIGFRITGSVLAMYGWLGVLYPNLVYNSQNIREIEILSDGSRKDVTKEWSFEEDYLWQILHAKKGEIQYKSKLLEKIKGLTEVLQDADQQETVTEGVSDRGV